MRTRVKICCIASVEEATMAIQAGTDAIGLVAAMPSGRGMVPDVLIADIASVTPPAITTVLLSSETSASAISQHVQRTRPMAAQIVSHIDPVESARLAAIEPHVRRVQVIHVEGPDALDFIPLYAPHIDAFLLDSGRPNAPAQELGGTGRVHDWAVSAAFVRASPRPVFLAGGLHPGNVMEAIHRVRPYGIDLCSGVRKDGHLDQSKLFAFMRQVKAADESMNINSRH